MKRPLKPLKVRGQARAKINTDLEEVDYAKFIDELDEIDES